MSFETIRLETDTRGITTLTLARPEKHNALSATMIHEIGQACIEIESNRQIRAVILAAEGRSFCAGGDLEWMRAQFKASRQVRIAEAMKLARMFHGLNTLSKPLIARVQGNAFGGGIGIMSVADVVIGARGRQFGLTETRLGLTPATISPYVIARLGEGMARRVFMSARMFDSQEAVALNLISRSVPAEQLDEAVEAEVVPYLQTSPDAVARTKALARSLGPVIDEAVMQSTAQALADCWESESALAGITAFFSKKPAPWVKL